MVFFILVYIAFIGYLLRKAYVKIEEQRAAQSQDIELRFKGNYRLDKRCPPHRWNYEHDMNKDLIMICLFCRQRPGQVPID